MTEPNETTATTRWRPERGWRSLLTRVGVTLAGVLVLVVGLALASVPIPGGDPVRELDDAGPESPLAELARQAEQ